MSKHFCNYEHMGGCSDWLTHRVTYWLGAARKQFGPYAFYCSAHAPDASHLLLQEIDKPRLRFNKSDVVEVGKAS